MRNLVFQKFPVLIKLLVPVSEPPPRPDLELHGPQRGDAMEATCRMDEGSRCFEGWWEEDADVKLLLLMLLLDAYPLHVLRPH